MGIFRDLLGTTSTTLQVGTAHLIKQITGGFAVRTKADDADGKVQADSFEATGDTGLIINSDASESGADWKITVSRPSSGMTASYELTLPADDGSPSQVLSTDGNGVLSWISAGATADKIGVNTTALAFGDSSPIALLTTPANSIILAVQIIVDTAFDGAPTLTIGVSGTTSKYMTSTQNDLTYGASVTWESCPSLPATAGESLIATYAQGGATQGAARILVHYAVPTT